MPPAAQHPPPSDHNMDDEVERSHPLSPTWGRPDLSRTPHPMTPRRPESPEATIGRETPYTPQPQASQQDDLPLPARPQSPSNIHHSTEHSTTLRPAASGGNHQAPPTHSETETLPTHSETETPPTHSETETPPTATETHRRRGPRSMFPSIGNSESDFFAGMQNIFASAGKAALTKVIQDEAPPLLAAVAEDFRKHLEEDFMYSPRKRSPEKGKNRSFHDDPQGGNAGSPSFTPDDADDEDIPMDDEDDELEVFTPKTRRGPRSVSVNAFHVCRHPLSILDIVSWLLHLISHYFGDISSVTICCTALEDLSPPRPRRKKYTSMRMMAKAAPNCRKSL